MVSPSGVDTCSSTKVPMLAFGEHLRAGHGPGSGFVDELVPGEQDHG